MIDKETVLQGISALGSAAAAIIEDVHEAAVTTRKKLPDYARAGADMRQAGADLASLGAAIEILARRGDRRD